MQHRWLLHPTPSPELIARLQQQLNNLPEPLARTLVLRGIESFEQAKLFFRPGIDQLHDPFLMRDMDTAADRLVHAINSGEKVLVYGDYDVDGTTATALMISFLRERGVEADFFIPDRFHDGYGLGEKGLDYAVEIGAGLVIALDCGITAHVAALYARSLGLDLIICDHHTAEETIPDAISVLNPKRQDCAYPFKELSGCGVGFKLIQATLSRLGEPPEQALCYLDLVAVSTASDIVPIVGENRVLMTEGLAVLKREPRVGFQMLAEKVGLNLETCTTTQIVFMLGPRINAAGRMGDARRAVELLIEPDVARARMLAARLEEVNQQRRTLDLETLEQAIVQADEHLAGTSTALVLHQQEWHLGVIGIVASRLVERYYRPAVMLSSRAGETKGSARSIPDFNIYDALKSCERYLTRFGGHMYAAGLTLPEKNIPAFREMFNDIARETLTEDMLTPSIMVDAGLSLHDVTPRFWAILKQFEPFGPQNKTPVFMAERLEVIGQPGCVGNGNHLKFKVGQGDNGSRTVFDVIGFGMGEKLPIVSASQRQGKPLEMLFSIEENVWNGRTRLQFRARDVREGE